LVYLLSCCYFVINKKWGSKEIKQVGVEESKDHGDNDGVRYKEMQVARRLRNWTHTRNMVNWIDM